MRYSLILIFCIFCCSSYAQPRFQAGATANWKSEPFFPNLAVHKQLVSTIPFAPAWNIQGFGVNLLAEWIPVDKLARYSLRADLELRYDFNSGHWQYDSIGRSKSVDTKGLIIQAHPMLYRRFGKKVKLGLGISFFNIGQKHTYIMRNPPDTAHLNHAFQALSLSITYPIWKERLWINHRAWYTIGGYPIYGHSTGAVMLGINVEYFFYQSKKQSGVVGS